MKHSLVSGTSVLPKTNKQLFSPKTPNARQRKCAFTVRASIGTGTQGKKVEKVVLAYSGGLDTSVILRWLQETYDCEVVTFTADLGQVASTISTTSEKIISDVYFKAAFLSDSDIRLIQWRLHAFATGACVIVYPLQGEELDPVRGKAEKMGVKEIYIDDIREEFVRDFVFPMFR